MNLYNFYHIYAASNNWREPVNDYAVALKKWGLYDNLTGLNIGIVGSQEQANEVTRFLNDQGINFNLVARENSGWEQVTQRQLKEFAASNDGYVLYSHSKGAANVSDTNTKWRRSMIYYNVGQWQEAVKALDEGYDCAGQHWMFPSHHSPEHKGWPFFGGTYWWTSLKFIRELPIPGLEHRHIAEGWIGENYYSRPMKCFDFTGVKNEEGYFGNSHPCHSLWKHDWI
jgi:hypothetical protein